jgi:hypothetical protein
VQARDRLDKSLAAIDYIGNELPGHSRLNRTREGDTAFWGKGAMRLPTWSSTRNGPTILPNGNDPPIAGLPGFDAPPIPGNAPAPPKPPDVKPAEPWPSDKQFVRAAVAPTYQELTYDQAEAAEEVKKALAAQQSAYNAVRASKVSPHPTRKKALRPRTRYLHLSLSTF